MKHAAWIIMKKELARFFGDRRLMFTTVLLPGLMIFFLYHFMGEAIQTQLDRRNGQTIRAVAVDLPASMKELFGGLDMELEEILEEEIPEAKEKIRDKKSDLCLIFPADFDEQAAAYETGGGTGAPLIQIYYNSSGDSSVGAFEQVSQLLDGYEETLCNKFDVNTDGQEYDLATEKDTMASTFASLLPMLVMMFLFSGCVSIAPESIAGEKERGTIATLLVTPVRREDIAIGKIGALSVIAVLSALSSVAGTLLSLPDIMQQETGSGEGQSASIQNVYHLSDYLLLAVVILGAVIVIVTMISILSAYAGTVKEAQTLAAPLMVVVMLACVTTMFSENATSGWQYYLIPLYNSVQCMVGIFSFKADYFHILVTSLSDLAFTVIGVWIVTRMFHQEQIMFS